MAGQAGRQAEVEAGRGRQVGMQSSSSRLVHGLEADGGRGSSVSNDQGQDSRPGQGPTDYDRLQYLDLRLETIT